MKLMEEKNKLHKIDIKNCAHDLCFQMFQIYFNLCGI